MFFSNGKGTGIAKPVSVPGPSNPEEPIGTVKRAWKGTLKKAGVADFPIYNLRHVFCTRLSWVAADSVVQRAMRHSSPETKRCMAGIPANSEDITPAAFSY